MTGSTPAERGKSLVEQLEMLYDDRGDDCNVIDILTDLRHLCDVQEWDFAELDRIAYEHYIEEKASGELEPHLLP